MVGIFTVTGMLIPFSDFDFEKTAIGCDAAGLDFAFQY
jgi:hypothetical protein